MELSELFGTRPNVTEIRSELGGGFTVSALHTREFLQGDPIPLISPVFYTLDSRLNLKEAVIGDAYQHAHARLEMAGRIHHRFSEREHAGLYPVLSWDGVQFIPIKSPIAPSDKTQTASR